MSKQNELREIIHDFDHDTHELSDGWDVDKADKCFYKELKKLIDDCEKQILALFREKARQTAHEAVPEQKEWHTNWNDCLKQTHKNIDDKFDAWGKK